MARQVAIERWRERAINAEADRDHFVKLLRELFDTDKGFDAWGKTRAEVAKFLELFPREV